MIPKTIHYIWFGPNPIPAKMQKCIASWKRNCPDYEFKLWNEENFDPMSSCKYVRDAYTHGQYAFVSDYVRLWALYNYGGVYLDTDMEMLRPLDDKFHLNRMTLGTDQAGFLMAFMMSEAGHPFLKESMESYHDRKFVMHDGSLNIEVINTYLQHELKRYGYHKVNEHQELKEGIKVYPDDYFSVRSLVSGKMNFTENSYVVHWHFVSWAPFRTKVFKFMRIKILVPLLGHRVYNNISSRLKNGKTTF